MASMRPLTPMLGAALLLLSGCDAWPTILDNRSSHSIRFHYHERSHEEWSAEFRLSEDEAQTLAREHWVQDITGLQIVENGRRYRFDYVTMEPLQRACSSSLLLRRLKFTHDCYLTYEGDGHVSASFTRPADIKFHDFGNGS